MKGAKEAKALWMWPFKDGLTLRLHRRNGAARAQSCLIYVDISYDTRNACLKKPTEAKCGHVKLVP